jgi:hypothetical protein
MKPGGRAAHVGNIGCAPGARRPEFPAAYDFHEFRRSAVK